MNTNTYEPTKSIGGCTVFTDGAANGYYPTPAALAKKLVEDLPMKSSMTILEPSAGTGNLIMALAEQVYNKYYNSRCYEDVELSVDCCETDPGLRGALKERFANGSDECKQLMNELEELHGLGYWEFTSKAPEEVAAVYEELKRQKLLFDQTTVRVVHDDFLTFRPEKHYDAIIMNPPFANGAAHLAKALQIQQESGGIVRCILNAETIRNPYNNQRKMLLQTLTELNAEITFEKGAFLDAERTTDVEVAIIKVDIPAKTLGSEFWERCEKARPEQEPEVEAPTDLVIPDIIKEFIARYRVEVEAGKKLIREYKAMAPYILTSANTSQYNVPIITMAISGDRAGENPSVNDYVRAVRSKYWRLLFKRDEFVGQLTSNLRDMLENSVKEMANYEFSEYNIRNIMVEMNAAMADGVRETILNLFETLTTKHSYSEEFGKNIHYYNGWKTNKAWKIGKKCIVPAYGLFPDYKYSGTTFYTYGAHRLLADIEKALNYLDGHMTAEVNLSGQLEWANSIGQTRNIHCKYFDVTFYKKGTAHIVFTCPDLIDRFNIYCAKQRNWLPPRYGYTAYANMDAEEQAVVDSFHGDGSSGSGEKVYAEIVRKSAYYLAPASTDTLALKEGVA